MTDNKLIAEFMSVPTSEVGGMKWYDYGESGSRNENDLYYHESWNWLMPVAEKCLTTDEPSDGQHYFINDALLTCNIEVVYDRVVEFIKEYNRTTDYNKVTYYDGQ